MIQPEDKLASAAWITWSRSIRSVPLVSGMYMFRHGGTEPTYTLPSGEVVKHGESMLRKQTAASAASRR